MRAAAQSSTCQTIPEESFSSAGAEKHMEPEFRFEEGAEGLAGGATARSQTRGSVVTMRRRKWRGGKVRPYTGKLSARPAGKPGDFFIVKGEFATIPSSPPLSSPTQNTGRPVCVLKASRNLSGPMVSKSKPKTKPWGGAVAPPAGRPRAQVAERAGRITLHLIVRR